MILLSGCAVFSAFAQTTATNIPKTADDSAKKTAADTKTPTTTPQAKPPTPVKIGKLIITGSLRLRGEGWNWYEPANTAYNPDYGFGAGVLRLGIGQKSEKFEWLAEIQSSFVMNLPEKSVAPAPQGQLGLGATYFAVNGKQDASIFLKQAFIYFKEIKKKASLKIGRFEFNDGLEVVPKNATLASLKRERISQRLIGAFGWSHVGRSFDGVQFGYNINKDTNLTIFSARPTEGAFQLHGWNELNVDLHYASLTKALKTQKTENEFRAFFIHYHDGRNVLKSDNRSAADRQADILNNIRLNTVGGNWLSTFKAGSGTIDLLAWGVGQFGSWGNQDHRAGAFALEAGYQFGGSKFAKLVKPWVRIGYNRSSGDDNSKDGTHKTFFQILPTPRIYARTPFFNLMNSEDSFVEFISKPHPKVSIRADLHYLRLSNTNDSWYSGGGAFQDKTFGYTARPSFGNKKLGWLTDVSLDYAISPHFSTTFYLGVNNKGSVQKAIYPLSNQLFFGYAELTAKF